MFSFDQNRPTQVKGSFATKNNILVYRQASALFPGKWLDGFLPSSAISPGQRSSPFALPSPALESEASIELSAFGAFRRSAAAEPSEAGETPLGWRSQIFRFQFLGWFSFGLSTSWSQEGLAQWSGFPSRKSNRPNKGSCSAGVAGLPGKGP